MLDKHLLFFTTAENTALVCCEFPQSGAFLQQLSLGSGRALQTVELDFKPRGMAVLRNQLARGQWVALSR